jgi:hypothetical protein
MIDPQDTFEQVHEALRAGSRSKADRVLRTAPREGVALVDVFHAAIRYRPATPAPPSELTAPALTQGGVKVSLTAEKAIRFAVKAFSEEQHSKVDAIMRHAVHQGISPSDLFLAFGNHFGIDLTRREDTQAQDQDNADGDADGPVISAANAEGSGVTQSDTTKPTSEEGSNT